MHCYHASRGLLSPSVDGQQFLFGSSSVFVKPVLSLFCLKKLHRTPPVLCVELQEDRKSFEFSVLVGNTLTSYSDVLAYKRGDHPTVSSPSTAGFFLYSFMALSSSLTSRLSWNTSFFLILSRSFGLWERARGTPLVQKDRIFHPLRPHFG